jgi:acyl-CoA thioesterase
MPKKYHPFADLIGLGCEATGEGTSHCSLNITERLYNPHGVVHGGVLYALADTGMGAALYTTLEAGELCATIEIKIAYFKPVKKGRLISKTLLVNRGKTVASLESEIFNKDVLVAKATGTYSIFTPTGLSPVQEEAV